MSDEHDPRCGCGMCHQTRMQREQGATESSFAAPERPVRCYICGSTHNVRMSPEWLTGLGRTWCFECFVAWYDYGATNLDEVRAKSLKLQAESHPTTTPDPA